MEKIKVIDILNKIANGEEVRFILLCDGDIYELTKDSHLYNETQREKVQWWIDEEWLNEEVEIIEEDKKIEKLDDNFSYRLKMKDILWNDNELIIVKKINEIIDCLNKEKK